MSSFKKFILNEDTDFKVGDRVEGIGVWDNVDLTGEKGTISYIKSYDIICVIWDKKIVEISKGVYYGHGCGETDPNKKGRGWGVHSSILKKISKSKYVKQLDFD